MPDPSNERLTRAALRVAGDVSERNAALSSKPHASGTVTISRKHYDELVAALEAEIPGVVARYRELCR